MNLPENLDRLDSQTQELTNEIISEQDQQKVKDLTDLFNQNLSKKNTVRLFKYNKLLDTVANEIQQRLDKNSEWFTNADLLNYLKILQDSVDKSAKSLNDFNENSNITINQTNNSVNIKMNEQELDRDSQLRILEAVNSYLKNINQQPESTIEVTEFKESETQN